MEEGIGGTGTEGNQGGGETRAEERGTPGAGLEVEAEVEVEVEVEETVVVKKKVKLASV